MHDSLADHPDLNDKAWIRDATKRSRRAARAHRPPRRRGRRGRRPSGLLVAGVVSALLLTASLVFRDALFGAPEVVTNTPTAIDRERPFVGSPAEGHPDGEAGITAPAATRIGSYSAKQVATAYSRVRALLITGRIDRRVLHEQQFDVLLAGLAPESREGVRKDLGGPSALAWATVVEPGARLLPVPPKAHGAMLATVDKDGRLVVDTDYAFAYAFDVPQADRPGQHVAMLRYKVRFTMTDTGPHPTDATGYAWSMSCAASARGRLAPPAPGDVALTDHAADVDPFDLAEPLLTEGTCP